MFFVMSWQLEMIKCRKCTEKWPDNVASYLIVSDLKCLVIVEFVLVAINSHKTGLAQNAWFRVTVTLPRKPAVTFSFVTYCSVLKLK